MAWIILLEYHFPVKNIIKKFRIIIISAFRLIELK